MTRGLALLAALAASCARPPAPSPGGSPMAPASTETATFGAGCFWCVEAVYQELDGVLSVESGYTGGHVENPTYRQVCDGTTGHVEVCRIVFDPAVIAFDDLLEVFWKTHDPTTPNRQGNDEGPQYRSVVFFHSEKQRALAEDYRRKLGEAGIWRNPIVTAIEPAAAFYKAEGYHQNYFKDNPEQGYCRLVIAPKIEKFRKIFKGKLKKD